MVTKRISGAVFLGLVLYLAVVWVLGPGYLGPAWAASYTVTKLTDANDGACDLDCSLREAIIAANADPDPDTITLGPCIHTLTITGAGENDGATGDLDITTPMTLTGVGPSLTVIDATSLISDRVLHVHPAEQGASTVMGVGCSPCRQRWP